MNVAESTVIETRKKNVNAQFSVLGSYYSKSINAQSNDMSSKFDDMAEEVANVFLNRIQIIDRSFNIVSDTYQINKGKLCISSDVNKCFNGNNQAYADKKNKCLVLTQAIKSPDSQDISYVMFATSSIADIYTAMDSIRLVVAAVVIILVVVLLGFAFFASYRMVKPFRKIEETIEHIGKGGTAERINLSGSSEIETISNSFNMMLDRINQLEESRQEFVSNVSHELKTPITSMKVLAESLVGQQGVPEELYQEFMGDIIGELDRENLIISDLLTLVKMDRTGLEMNISQVNINDLIEAQLRLLRPLAAEKNIELVFESYRPIIAEVDETKFSMCISNLVGNAIKYNNNDGWVHVSLNADATYFYVKVQDNGFGIPEDSLEHIFDRFYRVDKARDRATGGTGLGLAITRSIVTAHYGTIKVFSEVDAGSTFTMQIPLTHVPE